MASQARVAFDENVLDVKALIDIHKEKGAQSRGRRYGLEVLNKSAIVLITAFWESYCEDIAAEGLDHIVKHAPNADSLPPELKKIIVRQLNNNDNQLAIWNLADDGWRTVLKQQLTDLQEARNRKLNTPKSEKIDELFLSTLGIKQISTCWKWDKTSATKASNHLDRFVTLRGAIAHRGKSGKSIKKRQVDDYFSLVKRLAAKTGGNVNAHVKLVTGRPLWTR